MLACGSCDCRRTRSGGVSHDTAEAEVGSPVPSWIPVGANLARGLMSLMGKVCLSLGESRLWQGIVTCPPGAGQVTPAEPEFADGSRDCCRNTSGGGSPDSRRTGSGPSIAILYPGVRHLGLGLNETNGVDLHSSRHFTCVAGRSHLPPCGSSRDTRRTGSGGHVHKMPPYQKRPFQRHLGSQRAQSCLRIYETNGDHLHRSSRVTCVAGKGHLSH